MNVRTLFLAAAVLSAVSPLPSAAAEQAAPSAAPPQARPAAPQTPRPAPLPPVAALPPTGTLSFCGYTIGPPAKLPPAGSGPVVYQYALCFEKQGGTSVIDPQTYVYYIQLKPSQPSQDRWFPYNDATEQIILQDFKRLWGTNFLDDLSIETRDFVFSNGVVGKVVIYNMEERQRIKIVDYVGSKKVEQSKIEEELKKKNIAIRLDSFIDPSLVRRVAGIVRDLYAEKGYQYAEVKPEIKEVSGGPKLVHLTFNITEGPKVKIGKVEFLGNKAVSDGTLARKLKDNKAPNFFSFILGTGTYKEDKWGDDAEKVIEYYRQKGYVQARVGQPELRVLEDSKDGKTRYIELQVPVTEGERYRVGEFNFAGNKVVKSEGLRPLFKLQTGDYYNEKKIRDGLKKAQELYGTGGYFEFVGYPDLDFPNEPKSGTGRPGSGQPGDGDGNPDAKAAAAPSATPAPPVPSSAKSAAPIVNVTMRMEEGKQYFVNRIIFVGNTTTHDSVIRREIRLFEGGVFNTEALKYSVRRINQLGYFKNVEGEAIDVQKTPGVDAKVDVKLKLEEQNRNQITFGAGVSQYDGFFGQLAFQTSNFMGRGETFSVSLQQGDLAKNYQVGFTEPFLFDRPITAGIDLYRQDIRYINQFTQSTAGGNMVWGFPVAPFARIFANYSYQRVRIKDINSAYLNPTVLQANPFLRDSLLVDLNGTTVQNGVRRIGKIGPSFVYNTVDNPIFPTTGRKYSLGFDFAGIGGNTQFMSPSMDGVWYFKVNNRTSIGLHGQFQYIRPYGDTKDLPIFEKVFLGGEYSIRGYDLRSVGPRDPISRLVTGGNKSLLFNAEYLINIAGPVRLVLFYDAGQVQDVGHSFSWKEPVTQTIALNVLTPDSASLLYSVLNPITSPFHYRTDTIGQASAFKTSTGAEIRFFMPVLNVPFRLIMAINPQRSGVLDNNLQPEKLFKFRFAVGTTF
jgi:outer membrane protein insertion porin family